VNVPLKFQALNTYQQAMEAHMQFDYEALEDNIFNRIWRCNETSADTARYYAQISIQELKKLQQKEEKAS
jgi:hypothetical protein